MSSPINFDFLAQNIDNYLEHLVPVEEINALIKSHESYLLQSINELEMAVFSFNKFRILSKFPNKKYYKNSVVLDRVFGRDLPKLKTIFQKLESDHSLTHAVYSQLANDKYFDEVWKIRPIEYLVVNIILLIYRTSVLTLNQELLIDGNGKRKVQISSAVEEMVFYYYLLGEELGIFQAFKIWLDNWSDEGFDEQLFVAVKNNKNVLQYGI
jgi:hypothetical protein